MRAAGALIPPSQRGQLGEEAVALFCGQLITVPDPTMRAGLLLRPAVEGHLLR
jgi:hypothetical protein